MSLFHGLLLFDIPDKDIGLWKENLGYRGVIDVWEIKEKGLKLTIQNAESISNEMEQEVWIGNENGLWETIGWYDNYEDAIISAKEWMTQNPQGW